MVLCFCYSVGIVGCSVGFIHSFWFGSGREKRSRRYTCVCFCISRLAVAVRVRLVFTKLDFFLESEDAGKGRGGMLRYYLVILWLFCFTVP